MKSTLVSRSTFVFVAALASALGACNSDDKPRKVVSSASPPASSGPMLPPAIGPSPHGPTPVLPPGHPTVGAGATTHKPHGKELVFTAQEGWTTETPSNAMRKAQFLLPRQGSDTEDANLVVTFLSMDGGGLDANLERWSKQLGKTEKAPHTARTVGTAQLIEMDLEGTYMADMDPGARDKSPRENWRMLMTWIKTDHGNYYVKLLGPKATVAHWKDSFARFVEQTLAAG